MVVDLKNQEVCSELSVRWALLVRYLVVTNFTAIYSAVRGTDALNLGLA